LQNSMDIDGLLGELVNYSLFAAGAVRTPRQRK